jgi:molybdate transport system ATP-binding protein
MTFFSVQNIHICLGDFSLQDVSLGIDRGDYLSVIGHTGAGKSILLESISGFYRPPKGRIFLEGQDISHVRPEKRHFGIVYQDYALLPHFTVAENIAYGLKKIQKKGVQAKVNEMAASLKIDHLLHRKPDTLSGGEQQRTALARSLVVEPKLLLIEARIKNVLPQGIIGTLILEIGDTLIPVHSTSSTLNHLHPCVQDRVFACIRYDAVRIVSENHLN